MTNKDVGTSVLGGDLLRGLVLALRWGWLGVLCCGLCFSGCLEKAERPCSQHSDCAASAPLVYCLSGRCQSSVCEAGQEQSCYEGPAGTLDVGLCRGGKKICLSSGVWSPCLGQILPQKEVCDRLDNDCNGQIDELSASCQCATPGEKRSCFSGNLSLLNTGLCQAGYQYCADDFLWGPCLDQILSISERCNDGLDNNCNGLIDEGCRCESKATQRCYGGPTKTIGQSGCKEGAQTCLAEGVWSECVGQKIPVQTDEGKVVCVSPIKPCREEADCLQGEACCGERCFNVLGDARNCGACGRACESGEVCSGGHCACGVDAPADCGGQCANLQTDRGHCGACGNRCFFQKTCQKGLCSCPQKHCSWVGLMQTQYIADTIVPEAVPRGFGYLKSSRSLVFVGDFSGKVILGKDSFQSGTLAESSDIFVVRFNQEGAVEWSKHLRSQGFAKAAGVVCDALEHCYIAGAYKTNLLEGSLRLQAVGGTDLFLLKIDRDGQILWARSYGTASQEEAYQLQLAEDGTLLLLGGFVGSETKLGPDANAPRCAASAGLTKTFFLAKFDAEGKALSIKGFQSEMQRPRFRLTRDGYVFVGGAFQSIFAEGTQIVTSKSLTDTDIFVMKLNAQHAVVWLRALGGKENDRFGGFAVASDGRVFVAGSFRGKLQVDNLPEHSAPTSDAHAFVVGLDAQGKALWSKAFVGEEGSEVLGALLDSKENLYITGRFAKKITFGKQDINTQRESIFISRLSTSGEPTWVDSIQKIGGNFGLFLQSLPVFFVDGEDSLFYAASFDGAVEYQGARFDGKDKPLGFDLFFGKIVP